MAEVNNNNNEGLKMNDQHYATPNADLKPDSTDVSELIEPLIATKIWVRLCSIMGFISTFFIVIAGFGLMVGGSAIPNMPLGAGLGIVYIAMGLLYFMPSLYLHKYAGAISQAQASQSSADVLAALKYQKSFWKFAGVLVLIMFVFFILGIGAAIMIPMMAGV